MDRFLVRKRCAESTPEPSKKLCTEGASVPALRGDPQRIISWNCNGLVPQLRNEWSTIRAFLERERPDVLCLQEVRIPAAGPKGCKRGDGQRRRRGEAKRDSQQEKDDWNLVEKTLLATFGKEYTFHWSLSDWKYSGTLMLIRMPLRPSHIAFTLPALAAAGHPGHCDKADKEWHPDGRIIFAQFETYDILATYAPNNGNDEAAFQRRAVWDKALLQELSSRTRPLLWIGDLNCAAEEADVTHPAWFMQQCYQGEPADMRGQPGFTLGERERFREILSAAGLVDIHRRLHPAVEPPPAEGPHYTWRGHPPVHQPVAKYHGKGMRIDYSLVTEGLVPRVEATEIYGRCAAREGFMGSDHSPILLVLGPSPAAKGGGAPEKHESELQ